jgi:hypothetical protein
MLKEYFLTAPLLKAPFALQVQNCVIELRGQEGYSCIRGPTQAAIDATLDDLVCVLIEITSPRLANFRVVLRSKTKTARGIYQRSQQTPPDWQSWAFSKLPLSSIPTVAIIPDEWEKIIDKMRE